MPLFEYICKACGAQVELLVTGNQKPVCPKCGSKKLEKQFSTFSAKSSGADTFAPSSCSTGACPASNSCASGTCPFTS